MLLQRDTTEKVMFGISACADVRVGVRWLASFVHSMCLVAALCVVFSCLHVYGGLSVVRGELRGFCLGLRGVGKGV